MTIDFEEGPRRVAKLCEEAVRASDGTWSSIRSQLAARLGELPGDDRETFEREIETILSFHQPMRLKEAH